MSLDNGQNLPDGWQWVKLGDVSDIVNGTTPKSEIEDYWNGDIIWITPTDLGKLKQKYIFTSSRKITQQGYQSCRFEIVPVNSVILSSRAPIGHLGIAKINLCTNQGCKSFIAKSDLNYDYLYFVLKNSVKTFQELGSGTTFKEISKAQLESFKIPLPPLPEQKRIAAILNEQMEAVQKARQATEAQLQAAKKLPAAYLREVFESDAAKSWERKLLGDFAETCSGTTPSRDCPEYYIGTIPWVKTGELQDNFIDETEEYINEKALQETSLKLLPVDTLLVAMYGQGQTRGRTGLLTMPATTNQACFAILPNYKKFYPLYLQWLFRHNYSRLRQETEGRGGNQPNLNGQILREQKILLPHLEIQKKIVATLTEQMQEVERLKQSLQEQLDTINKLPAALLRRAFNGEL